MFDNSVRDATIIEGKETIKEEVNKVTKKQSGSCYNCGKAWPHSGECPAKGKVCRKCNKNNHFERVCKSKNNTSEQKKDQEANEKNKNRVNQVNERKDDQLEEVNGINSDKNDNIFTIDHVRETKRFPECEFLINGARVKLKIDTHASINIIDERDFEKLKMNTKLQPYTGKAFAYGVAEPIKTLGKFDALLEVGTKKLKAEFIVTRGRFGSLLGYPTSAELGVDPVLQIVNTVDEPYPNFVESYTSKYPEVFSGKIGKLKDFELELHIDRNVKPIQMKPRNIPFHYREKVDNIIKEKLDADIIEEVVNEPTSWLLELVIVPKPNGDIRVCLDTRPVNKAILREKYQMPNPEEIIQLVNGWKYFTIIDLNSAFEHIVLHQNSRYIATFRTHNGIYRYKRLFFGISSAPEIFHSTIKKLLQHIKNQTNASDDIIMGGATPEEHDLAVNQVLSCLRDNGLTANATKCKFFKSEIKFFGL